MGLFTAKEKPETPSSVNTDHIRWQSGAELLKQKPFTAALDELRNDVSATPKMFTLLYHETLKGLAETVQIMPSAENKTTLLFSDQFTFAFTLLKLARGKMIPAGRPVEDSALAESRWIYGIFTCGLLYQLAEILQARTVIFFDATGNHKKYWLPWSIIKNDSSQFQYQVTWGKSAVVMPVALYRAALVQRVIPETVMHWFMEDAELFTQWSAILCDENSPSVFHDLLREAANNSDGAPTSSPAATPEKTAPAEQKQNTEQSAPTQTKPAAENTATIAKEPQPVTPVFLEWLAQQIVQNNTLVNNAIYRVDLGLLVVRDFLQAFAQQQKMSDSDLFIVLHNEKSVLLDGDSFIHAYRPCNLTDFSRIQGIVFNESSLTPGLLQLAKNKTIQTDFLEETDHDE